MLLIRSQNQLMRGRNRFSACGFTMVELVIIIVLLGIVATVAMSRLLRGDAFNAFVLRDQIISLSHTAQQASLGRDNVIMTITPDGAGSVTLTTAYNGGATTIESVVLDMNSVSLTGDVNDTSSCATPPGSAITTASPFTLRFTPLGDLGASGFGAGTAVTSAVRICLNNSVTDSVCLSPAGFAYAGDCDV
ncbi:MAG: type II secretion system protein [Pseudomonadales bacterium]